LRELERRGTPACSGSLLMGGYVPSPVWPGFPCPGWLSDGFASRCRVLLECAARRAAGKSILETVRGDAFSLSLASQLFKSKMAFKTRGKHPIDCFLKSWTKILSF